jgi:hypothetical protein
MADHKRLDMLTDLIERSGAKLLAVGDGKQLPSIGPGGMFDRLAQHAPTIELQDIHRTTDLMTGGRGRHYALENPSGRWRTTKPGATCISRIPATRQPRTPSKRGHASPRATTCVRSR